MSIHGPVSEEWVLDTKRYKGIRGVDLEAVAQEVGRQVTAAMEEEMGMSVQAEQDEYVVGGGLFKAGTSCPAVTFRSTDHPEYAMTFAAFKLTAALLEVTVAQGSPASKNWQKVQAGKMFADKEAAHEEDLFYSALVQCILEAIDF